jgi:hypothetical protein
MEYSDEELEDLYAMDSMLEEMTEGEIAEFVTFVEQVGIAKQKGKLINIDNPYLH